MGRGLEIYKIKSVLNIFMAIAFPTLCHSHAPYKNDKNTHDLDYIIQTRLLVFSDYKIRITTICDFLYFL